MRERWRHSSPNHRTSVLDVVAADPVRRPPRAPGGSTETPPYIDIGRPNPGPLLPPLLLPYATLSGRRRPTPGGGRFGPPREKSRLSLLRNASSFDFPLAAASFSSAALRRSKVREIETGKKIK